MYHTFFIHAPVDGHIGCFHSEESQKGKNKCILTQICGIWKTIMLLLLLLSRFSRVRLSATP